MRILKVIGLLLEYPDELLWENRDDALALVRADVPSLTPFVSELLTAPLLDRQAEWCEVFERGRATSLLLFEHVHSADSVRAGADDHPLLRPASGRQRNAQAGGLGAGGGHLPRRRLGASGRCRMDLPRPPGARNDHLSDLPLHPPGSRLERAGGIFHPALPGGTLPALSAGGVYHSSLPVARTRPSRQVRVFIVPGSRLYAGWRLSPYPAYRVLSQAQTSQARASAAPPGKISDTVPVISPGGGCRLTRSTGSSHRLIPVGPRKRSARRARYQARFL